jgi:hypothetical protein
LNNNPCATKPAAKLGKYAMPPCPCKNPPGGGGGDSERTGQQDTGKLALLLSSGYRQIDDMVQICIF